MAPNEVEVNWEYCALALNSESDSERMFADSGPLADELKKFTSIGDLDDLSFRTLTCDISFFRFLFCAFFDHRDSAKFDFDSDSMTNDSIDLIVLTWLCLFLLISLSGAEHCSRILLTFCLFENLWIFDVCFCPS